MPLSGAGFSLRGLKFLKANPVGLRPALLNSQSAY